MTQGITGLPGAPQSPQGMPPGMPPSAPPGAVPQPPQQAATPMAVTGLLQKLDPRRLLAMFGNPMDKTPKWAVVSAYAKAIENQRMMDAARGQSAMQQNQAQQGQPPIAAQVMSQPLGPSEPVMARDGGLMRGYAGGGAVAFNSGGNMELETYRQKINEYRQAIEQLRAATQSGDPSSATMYAQKVQALRSTLEPALMAVAEYRTSKAQAPEYVAKLLETGIPDETATPITASRQGKSGIADIDIGPSMAPFTGAAAPAARPPAAPAVTPSGTGGGGSAGLDALIKEFQKRITQGEDPRIAALRKQSEAAAQAQEAQLRGFQTPNPEEIAARKAYYEAVGGAYEPQRKSLEAAKAAQREGLFESPEALARIAGSLGGAKRFGEGLSKAAGAAGDVLGERRKRAERLEERYQDLSAQMAITMAQARRADVEGDEKRKRDLLIQAQAIKDKQLGTQMEMLKIDADLRGKDVSGLASLVGARAQERAAAKPTGAEFMYNAYVRDPKLFSGYIAAQQEPKSTAAMRKELAEQWSKNIMLQQKFPNFDDFVAAVSPDAAGADTQGFKVLGSRPKQ